MQSFHPPHFISFLPSDKGLGEQTICSIKSFGRLTAERENHLHGPCMTSALMMGDVAEWWWGCCAAKCWCVAADTDGVVVITVHLNFPSSPGVSHNGTLRYAGRRGLWQKKEKTLSWNRIEINKILLYDIWCDLALVSFCLLHAHTIAILLIKF